ncbi:hypothetical protein JCM10212_000858 [Sporobolomyces blumeae]
MGLFHAIEASCSSLTHFEYCASPPTDSTCNVVPISGPGTVFAFVVGSFLNLMFALIFRPEAPYNLFLQLLSVDGALISLVDRYWESTNRLDLFSYCFVPLSICSCIPVAVAICLCRLDDLHVLSPAAAIQLRKDSKKASGPLELTDQILNHRGSDPVPHNPAVHEHAIGKRGRTLLGRTKDKGKGPARDDVQAHSTHPDDAASLSSSVFRNKLPHRTLPGMLIWFFFGHLVAYTLVFAMVYATVSKPSQENCVDEFGLTRWRIAMGSFAAVFLVVGWFFWWILWRNVKHAHSRKKTSHSGVLALANLFGTKAYNYVNKTSFKKPGVKGSGVKNEKILRVAICMFFYLLWAIPYLTIYFMALRQFLMLGPNPWPFEQVAATLVSIDWVLFLFPKPRTGSSLTSVRTSPDHRQTILVPFLIVGRGLTDRDFQLKALEPIDDRDEARKHQDRHGNWVMSGARGDPGRIASRGGSRDGLGQDAHDFIRSKPRVRDDERGGPSRTKSHVRQRGKTANLGKDGLDPVVDDGGRPAADRETRRVERGSSLRSVHRNDLEDDEQPISKRRRGKQPVHREEEEDEAGHVYPDDGEGDDHREPSRHASVRSTASFSPSFLEDVGPAIRWNKKHGSGSGGRS